MRYRKTLTFCLAGFLLITGCEKKSLHKTGRSLMGTLVHITIISADERRAYKASEAAYAEIARIEALMSPYKRNSDIHKINNPASERIEITPETFALIQRSLDISSRTDGAFDITFASLSHLWRFSDKVFTPPDDRQVRKCLPLVNYRNIRLNTDDKSLTLLRKNVRLGLGGIAKGYALRKAMEILKKRGITDAIVEAGGDLQVLGSRGEVPWSVGLAHPRRKAILALISMTAGESVATSGDYERFALYKGKRYHHIINPRTGYPARGLISVSVLTADPVEADAYATALFVMGKDKAVHLLQRNPRLKAVLIDRDLKVYASRELMQRFTPTDGVEVEWF